jgi:hypothetical protein
MRYGQRTTRQMVQWPCIDWQFFKGRHAICKQTHLFELIVRTYINNTAKITNVIGYNRSTLALNEKKVIRNSAINHRKKSTLVLLVMAGSFRETLRYDS